jgi:hypothetical protein
MIHSLHSGGWVAAALLLASAVPSAADPIALNPNTQKYADRKPTATGRSGTATLSARALIGKDGQTVLEMTTGGFESETGSPGQIVKAQVKGLTASGEAAFTLNYMGLESGYVAYTYADFRRGQPLEVQTNVRGVDGSRTDVVAVSDVVRARPDLAVDQLAAPEQAIAGTPVNISAVVTELNGDTGARANCLLYVDEVLVDRADGVWVDSGDSVTCAFAHVFDTSGAKALKVVAGEVRPGDWDTENNSATATIEIMEPFDRVEGYFGETSYLRNTMSRGGTTYPTSGYDYDSGSSQSGWNQGSVYHAWIFQPVAFPVDVEAAVSDGAQVSAARVTGVRPDFRQGNPDGWCDSAYRSASSTARTHYFFVGVCNVRGLMVTLVDHQRSSGAATYFSQSVTRGWYTSGGRIITYEYGWTSNSSGPPDAERLQGPNILLDVTLTTAGIVYERPVEVLMNRTSNTEWDNPETCSSWVTPWYSGYSCSGSSGYYRSLYGNAVVGSPDPRSAR